MNVIRNASPPDSPPAESTGTPGSGDSGEPSHFGVGEGVDLILFESYLYKIPPLSKSILMVKWSKRWFTLRKTDMSASAGVELCYYKDISRKEKKRVIDLSQITGIRPTPKIGSTEHIFAIETAERKYILKAADLNTKNIWLAKLCEFCGQEPVFHVTVPRQPPVTLYNEAILKLSSDTHVTVVLPSTSESILSIKYSDIRRMGYSDTYNNDIIWFETCKNSQADRFFFFVIPSGMEVARQIVQELKATIQTNTSSLLILEDSSNMDLSYIAREHYGCAEYSIDARSQILQSGLYRLPQISWRSFATHERVRKESAHAMNSPQESNIGGVSLEEFGRRKSKSVRVVGGGLATITRRPTLDKFVRQSSTSSFDRQASISSFDRSVLSTPSLDRDISSPSLHEVGDSHFSSGSGSDVFDSPYPSHSHIQRNLSLQSSISSQGSSNGSSSHSPSIPEQPHEESPFDFNAVAMSCERSSSYSPVVPPRSVVSLQQDSQFVEEIAAAH